MLGLSTGQTYPRKVNPGAGQGRHNRYLSTDHPDLPSPNSSFFYGSRRIVSAETSTLQEAAQESTHSHYQPIEIGPPLKPDSNLVVTLLTPGISSLPMLNDYQLLKYQDRVMGLLLFLNLASGCLSAMPANLGQRHFVTNVPVMHASRPRLGPPFYDHEHRLSPHG